MSQQPIYFTEQQPYVIYDVNNMPYIAYTWQPDILWPVYYTQPMQPENQRMLPEIVTAVGDVVQDEVNSLENYVKKMEQEAIKNAQEKLKSTNCVSWLCSR